MVTNRSAPLPPAAYDQLIDLALREDLGAVDVEADLTAAWTVAGDAEARARIIARQAGVVAGIEVARAVFARLDGSIAACTEVADGAEVAAGQTLVRLQGRARSLLAGERTALNFLQQLSGVATLTQCYVEALAGTAHAHHRHPQNYPRLAALTEVGRAHGRRRQSPHGPVRCRADQGKPTPLPLAASALPSARRGAKQRRST